LVFLTEIAFTKIAHGSKTHTEKFTPLQFAFLTFSHDTSILLAKAVNQFCGGIVNQFVETYRNILDGVYLCFDRIVINGYFRLLNSPGGMVTWFRRLEPDKPLTKNQLLRFAYRATRRLYAFAAANKIQILENVEDERKHEVAQAHLKNFEKEQGIFLIMKVREMAPVYDSQIPKTKPDTASPHLDKKFRYVSYYYFHIKDRKWGHVTIGISPHPPFAARIILNAHDWLAKRADQRGLYYKKCENCLIDFTDEQALQKLADTLNEGHLLDVCQRWAPRVMMSLTTEEIRQSGLERQFFFCQTECCFNMLFRQPRHLNWVYQNLIDNTRQRLRPGTINTIFGKDRRGVKFKSMSVRIENPEYNLTVVNVWLGKNRVKIYDKGESRRGGIEVTINRPKELRLLKSLAAFPQYRRRMENMIRTFMDVWQAADQCRLPSERLEELQAPVIKDNTRLPGISLTNRRLMAVLGVTIEMAKRPNGFASAELYAQVVDRLQNHAYTKSQLNYDLRKLKAKEIIEKVPASHRYKFSKNGIQMAVGLLVFRNEILQPVLSASHLTSKRGPRPKLSARDQLYRNIQINLEALCIEYGLKPRA
jgi:hypothetical protein